MTEGRAAYRRDPKALRLPGFLDGGSATAGTPTTGSPASSVRMTSTVPSRRTTRRGAVSPIVAARGLTNQAERANLYARLSEIAHRDLDRILIGLCAWG